MKYVLRALIAVIAIACMVAGAIVVLNNACEAYSNRLFENEVNEAEYWPIYN